MTKEEYQKMRQRDLKLLGLHDYQSIVEKAIQDIPVSEGGGLYY